MAGTNNNAGTQTHSTVDELLQDAEERGVIEKDIPGTDTSNQGGDGSPDPNKKPENEQKPEDLNNEENKANPQTKPNGTPTNEPAGNEDVEDIEDEKLLKALQKRGFKGSSLSDINTPAPEPTEEEKRAAAEQRRAKSIDFGIKNGVFTQSEYDASVKFAARNPVDVVKETFIAELKTDDPNLSDEDAEALFMEHFFLYEDEDSFKYKTGQKRLTEHYTKIANDKYGKINGIGEVYDEVENNNARARVYKTQVDEIFATQLPKQFSFTINNEPYHFDLDKTLADKIKKDYLTVEMMNASLDRSGKVDAKGLLEDIQKEIFWAQRDKIISEIANSVADKRVTLEKAGRKGIIRPDDGPADKPDTTVAKKRTLADEKMGDDY